MCLKHWPVNQAAAATAAKALVASETATANPVIERFWTNLGAGGSLYDGQKLRFHIASSSHTLFREIKLTLARMAVRRMRVRLTSHFVPSFELCFAQFCQRQMGLSAAFGSGRGPLSGLLAGHPTNQAAFDKPGYKSAHLLIPACLSLGGVDAKVLIKRRRVRPTPVELVGFRKEVEEIVF